MGFSGEMQVASIGKGLVKLSDLVGTSCEALFEDKSTLKVTSKPIAYSNNLVRLIIHSEDSMIKDISIDCTPNQEFKLRNGDLCTASNLKGKRLISIGQNSVYCIDVIPICTLNLVFRIQKLDYGRDEVYINGILVLM